MDKSQLASWFIVLIMVFSSLGFVSFYFTQSSDKPLDEDIPPIVAEETTLAYTAANIEAKVTELIPSAVITADTEELNITEIDNQIYSIGNITKLVSQYRQTQVFQISSGLIYVAEVQFDKSISPAEFIEAFREKVTSLPNPQIVLIGLVKVPSKVILQNNDLNLTKEYTFPENIVHVYLSEATMQDDTVLITIDTQFKGEKITAFRAFEAKNLSATPQIHNAELTLSITDLKPRLLFNAIFPYYLSHNKDSLASLFEEAHNLTISELKLDYDIPRFNIYFDSEQIIEDQNGLILQLQELPSVRKAEFYDEKNFFSVDFNKNSPDFDYETLKASVMKVFEKAGFAKGEFSFEEPFIHLNADSNVSGNIQKTARDLELSLSVLGAKNPAIFQTAVILLEILQDPSTGNDYTLEEGQFNALVLPTHKPNDKVTLVLQFYTNRDKVVFVQAMEKETPKDNAILITQ